MTQKTEQITLLRAVLVTQMNHWIFFPVYVTCILLLGDIVGYTSPRILLWFLLGAIPFMLYLGRQKIKSFWKFALLHLAVVAVMFLLPAPHIAIRVFWILLGVSYAVYSIYLQFKTAERQDTKIYPLFSILIPVVMLAFLHHQGHYDWDQRFVTTLIITLGLYFLVYYIERYLNFLKVNNSSAGHIPATEMFHSGMGLVIGYTSIGILILIFLSNLNWLRNILNYLKKLFLAFTAWFLSLFPRGNDTVTEEITDSPPITMMDDMGMLEVGETFWLWSILEEALEILVMIGLVFALIKGLLFLFKFIRNKMVGLQRKNDNYSDEKVIDVREKCDIVKQKGHSLKLPFWATDPRERIRQMYKKRILSSRKLLAGGSDSALKQYTARESAQMLECEQLADIYEKARYSQEECNYEDVKRMKIACK